MPKNSNILMVRHAEKPDSGKRLSVAGQERAHAYAVYFQNYMLNGTLLKLSYTFATADSSQSQRPRLTMEPLANAMGMEIDARYQENDYQKVADEILQNSKYHQSNILICWHHGEILELAAALEVDATKLPPQSHWPSVLVQRQLEKVRVAANEWVLFWLRLVLRVSLAWRSFWSRAAKMASSLPASLSAGVM